MAYRLKAKETVPDGIRRIVGEEIDSAVRVLGVTSRAQRDEAIHEARKSVKKIRGILRVMRGELGALYRQENERFRATGHKLSELRDAAALLEAFGQIASIDKNNQNAANWRKVELGLERWKKKLEQRLDAPRVAGNAARVLAAAKARVEKWPLKREGFAALAPGLKATYRQGRKVLKKARRTEDAVDFHDLRKRVKDHWYHVRLFESLWTDVMQAHEASLKELETWLGDDHNLVVLRQTLEAHPHEFGGEELIRAFLKLVEARQNELREKSISLAEHVYGEKPGQFVGAIRDLWQTWQQQPESIQEVEKEQQDVSPRKPPKAAGSRAHSGRKQKTTAA